MCKIKRGYRQKLTKLKVVSKTIQLSSRGQDDVIDITKQVSNVVKDSNIKNGTVTIFVAGSTAAITTIEYEPGLINDFPEMLARIIPKNIEYEHDNTWHGFPSDHSLDQVKECRFRPKYCYRKFKKFWYQEPGLY